MFTIRFSPRLPALESYLESMVNLPESMKFKEFVGVIKSSVFTVYTIYKYANSGNSVCLPNDFSVNFISRSALNVTYRSMGFIDFEFMGDGNISICISAGNRKASTKHNAHFLSHFYCL